MDDVLKHLMARAQDLILAAERGEEADPRPYLEEIVDRLGVEGAPPDEEAELFARRWIARLDGRAGQWEAVVSHLERATEIDPTDAPSWADLGEACARLGRVEHAVAAVREAVTLDPDEAMYAFALGNLYLGPLEQPRRALPLLERAAAKRPDEPAALLSLARCLIALGRRDEARARLERARELTPGSAPLKQAVEQALSGLMEEPEGAATDEAARKSAGEEAGTPGTAGTDLAGVDGPAGAAGAAGAGESDAPGEQKPGLLEKAGALVDGFLGALGATKDQAIGALLATLLGEDLKRLHDRHAELAAKSPEVTPLTLAQFQELLGERIRLAVREGMEKATPLDAARAAELDKLLRVEEIGMRKRGISSTAKGPAGVIIEAEVAGAGDDRDTEKDPSPGGEKAEPEPGGRPNGSRRRTH